MSHLAVTGNGNMSLMPWTFASFTMQMQIITMTNAIQDMILSHTSSLS